MPPKPPTMPGMPPRNTIVILSEEMPSRSEGISQSKDPCTTRAAMPYTPFSQHRRAAQPLFFIPYAQSGQTVVAGPLKPSFGLRGAFAVSGASGDKKRVDVPCTRTRPENSIHLWNYPTQAKRRLEWATLSVSTWLISVAWLRSHDCGERIGRATQLIFRC